MRDGTDPITDAAGVPDGGSDGGGPILPSVETTRFTAEQWKSRALYEEACKLAAEHALARAMDVIRDALFAAAHVRAGVDDAEPADARLHAVESHTVESHNVESHTVESRAGVDSGTMGSRSSAISE
jgi:hypothetical protein